MITVEIGGTDQAIAAIRARGPRIIQAVVRRMSSALIGLQQYIVAAKLSGQVLHHRSGKLANSIRFNGISYTDDVVTGEVQGAGGPAFYGRVHEFGGVFNVREHIRRVAFNAAGETVKVRSRKVFGVEEGTVRAHTATYPERSFMRTSFAEKQENLIEAIRRGLQEGSGNG